MADTAVYAVNKMGATVVIALPPHPGSAVAQYEVTQLSTDARSAHLRLSQS
jgi:hypothetical protein